MKDGAVKAVVLLHDEAFSSAKETDQIREILGKAAFSLALEPIPSALGEGAAAQLPVATYLEEQDFVVNHEGELRRYQKALEPPKGIRPAAAWLGALRDALTAQPA